MMNYEFQHRDKIPVAILGATGSVGQRFVEMLTLHPWFTIAPLAASERSQGKTYREAVNWLMVSPLDEEIGKLEVQACEPGIAGTIVFSALDAAVAADIEKRFADAGYIVISNSSHHRMDPDVPLLIPEVNASHLELLHLQKYKGGKIITNPNCTAIGLTLALKPLFDKFGIEAVNVVTMQAVSGAGYPGVSSMDILDNVIPYISGEEEKVEREPLKILGTFKDSGIVEAPFKISAQCNRVPVTDGHTECVSVKLKSKATANELIEAWNTFSSDIKPLNTLLAPERATVYYSEPNYPQPKLHRSIGDGMGVAIGRLRPCPLLDYKFTLCSNNTIRGAAGGAILCAELLLRKGYIFW